MQELFRKYPECQTYLDDLWITVNGECNANKALINVELQKISMHLESIALTLKVVFFWCPIIIVSIMIVYFFVALIRGY